MKKDEERWLFEMFAKLRPELAITNVRFPDRPDVVCSISGIDTGIELTQFFFPTSGSVPPQAVDGYRNRLARLLCEEHAKRGIPPLHISVHFFQTAKLVSNAARQLLAAHLLDFIAQRVPSTGPLVVFKYEALTPELIGFGVDHLSVVRSPAFTEPFWSMPHAAFIPDSCSALIQDIIDEKSANESEYRKKAPSLWLLIVSGGSLHSMVNLEGDILTRSYTTAFDRMFLLRTFSQSMHELKIA